jgi:YidC/Oxa1 family membrane protein insertase
VFFALYHMLATAFELRRAPFFGWIVDLSEPDRIFTFAQPIDLLLFSLHSINLLPLLMAVVMWANTKLMPMTGPGMSPEQKMMLNFMPVMFSLFCYTQAAGLSLYIITSTLLGMGQTYFVNRLDWDVDVSKKPAKPGASKKHWYEAALDKKKQLEKEQKDMKKATRDAALRGDGPTSNDKKSKQNNKKN